MEGFYRFVECTLDYAIKYPLASDYTENDEEYYCEAKNDIVSSYDCATPEECKAANLVEINLYKKYGNMFECLCPINLNLSSEDELYMDRAEVLSEYHDTINKHIYNYDYDNPDEITKVYIDAINYKRQYNNDEYHSGLLETAFAALIVEKVLKLSDVIAFFDELDTLYYEEKIDLYEDLHNGNIGILNGKPVVIDYAGTEVY